MTAGMSASIGEILKALPGKLETAGYDELLDTLFELGWNDNAVFRASDGRKSPDQIKSIIKTISRISLAHDADNHFQYYKPVEAIDQNGRSLVQDDPLFMWFTGSEWAARQEIERKAWYKLREKPEGEVAKKTRGHIFLNASRDWVLKFDCPVKNCQLKGRIIVTKEHLNCWKRTGNLRRINIGNQ